MNIQIEQALKQLNYLKKIEYDTSVDAFVSCYDEILSRIPDLRKEELIYVSSSVFEVLNNENSDAVFMKQIPIDMSDIILGGNLLSTSDVTSMFVKIAKHFLEYADQWIHDVYYYGYILYAVRKSYDFREIENGISENSSEDICNFKKVIQKINYNDESWEEGSEKINTLLSILENDY